MKLVDKDWEVLVVLDACRYDFFEENYEDFLSGELTKRESPACRTPDWFKAEFGKEKHEDIVYVSANPHINSVTSSEGIMASENFHKVVDVWNSGWDEEKDTVPPEKVKEAALDALEEYEDKRIVVHYIQPHYPYLGKTVGDLGWFRENDEYSLPEKAYRYISFKVFGDNLNDILGRTRAWKVRNALKLAPSDGKDEETWRQFKDNIPKWKDLYEDNLRQALSTVKDLVEETEKKTVVTGDHGEAFGEHGVFLHPSGADIPELKEVPWLKVSD